MKKIGQKGQLNLLIIPLILVAILFIVAIIIGFYEHNQEQKYKTQTDQIVAAHVSQAKLSQQKTDAKLYQEKAKQPFVTYDGPSDFGSLQIQYPKTWSVYVENKGSSNPVSGYAYPGQVPGVDNDQETSYALRFEITSDSYDQVVHNFNDQVQQGKVTVKPFALKKLPDIVGVKVDGEVQQNKQGSMIILPLRNMTLEVWTEAQQFEPDFNNYILPNLSFKP